MLQAGELVGDTAFLGYAGYLNGEAFQRSVFFFMIIFSWGIIGLGIAGGITGAIAAAGGKAGIILEAEWKAILFPFSTPMENEARDTMMTAVKTYITL